MSTLELELNSKGEFCKKRIGSGRRWSVDEDSLITEILKENKCSYEDAVILLDEMKSKAIEKSNDNNNLSEILEEAIKEINPFKYLKIIESTKFLVVWEKDNKVEILGSLDMLNSKKLSNLLVQWEPELEGQLMSLNKYLNAKNPHQVSFEDILQTCINVLNPKSNLSRILTEDEDIHPSTIEGCNIPSLRKIPYYEASVDFLDMNEFLQEFLGRVHNHKHLCAILWGQVTGKKWPYLCYLYGKDGREGKTSFINMLGDLTKSYSTLTEDGRFALFPLYGKSIIMVPENDKSRLVSNKVVKAITGGSRLSIEEKGRTSFSGMIRGTLIVDANVPLRIGGRSFETERLSYHSVSPNIIPKNKRVSPDKYTKIMGSTPNEFLNYCRLCFEELVSEGGMLTEAPDHQQIMDSLSDEVEEYEFSQLLKTKLSMAFQPELTFEKAKLISLAKEKCGSKRDFYLTSFLHYLEKNGVIIDGKVLKGIGKSNQQRVDDLTVQIKEAMPK